MNVVMDAPEKSKAEGQAAPEPEAQWQYNSQRPAAASAEAFNQPAVQARGGAGSVEWTASEFIAHQKNAGWYLVMAGIVVAIAGVIYLFTQDLFSVIAIVVLAVIVGVSAGHQPRVITYRLDGRGLTAGKKFYPYGIFKAFSLIDEGPFASITFAPLKRFMPPVSVYFSPEDEERILDVLSRYLPLEPPSQDFFDNLMRQARF